MAIKTRKQANKPKVPRERYVVVSGINFSCDPHPKGCYAEFLQIVAQGEYHIPVRGVEHIAMEQVQLWDPAKSKEIYMGYFVKFTKIDMNGDWVDTSSGKPAPADTVKAKVDIDPTLSPNASWHPFYFNPSNHIFVFAVTVPKNLAQGKQPKSLTPRLVEKYFTGVLDHLQKTGLYSRRVSITIIPDEQTLTRILNADKIRRLSIVIKKPNHTDEDWEEQMEEQMEEENVTHYEEIRSSPTGIIPSEKTKAIAKVAVKNGHVEASILEGKKLSKVSTTEHPMLEKRVIAETETPIDVLRAFY